MPAHVPCPEPTRYQQLAAGQLTPADEEALLGHLENCDHCAQQLNRLPEQQTLGDLIRQAQTLGSEPSGEVVARLVDRLSQLRPAGAPVAAGAENTVAHQPGTSANEHLYDFLAPAQGPDELGRLGPYRVLDVLGSGGMGVVFRAEDPHLQRPVALKAMLPTLAVSESARQRFLREARAAAAIKYDHIVTIYQVGEDRGVPYLAMEFLEGEPLDVRLQREGKLPVAEVLRIGREIALGLAAAHQRGLIHRDIKPANIWLEESATDEHRSTQMKEKTADESSSVCVHLCSSVASCRVKILDFGLARASGEGGQLTQQGAIVGTPAYMAPEQGQGKAVDPRCDLFSLGCVLYRMATGEQPFKGTDMISTLMAVATEHPRSPQQLEPGLPPALSELILRLLAKEPDDRPASAQVVARELDVIAHPRPPVTGPRPSRKVRRRIAAVVVGLLLAGVVGLWAAGMLKVKTKEGTIVLEGLPPDAEVLVDGAKIAFKPGPDGKWVEVEAAPGERKLLVQAAGFETKTESITLRAGERTSPIHIRLEPIAAVPRDDNQDRQPPATKTQALAGTPAPQPSASLLALRRDKIAPDALAAAGDGDPRRVPDSLVAILGDPGPIHNAYVTDLAFSRDGRWLASASFDRSVHLWDVAAGQVRRVLRGHTGGLTSVSFTPDGRTLVSASEDGTLKLWSTEDEQAPTTLQPNLGIVTAAISPDGRFLAAGGAKGVIKLWNWGQWNSPTELPVVSTNRAFVLTFSPDGQTLACGWLDDKAGSAIGLYHTTDGKLMQTLPTTDTHVRALAFSPDGKALASAGYRSAWIWDLATGKPVEFKMDRALRPQFSPDGKRLAVGGDGMVFIYDVASRAREGGTDVLACGGFVEGLAFSPDGKLLAAGDRVGAVHFFDTATWGPRKDVLDRGHRHWVKAVALDPEGRTLVSLGTDNTLRRWPLDRPGENQVLRRFDQVADRLVFGPDGKTFATANPHLIIWDAATGKEKFTIQRRLHNMTYSPDGHTIAGQSFPDNVVRLWDVRLGQEVHRFPSMKKEIAVALAFRADGRHLAAAGSAGSLVVWDVTTGDEVKSWKDTLIRALAFRPDGVALASGHENGAISVWDPATGETQRTYQPHNGRVVALRFTPDGRWLLSAGIDGVIQMRNPEHERARLVIPIGKGNHPVTFDLDRSGQYLAAAGPSQAIFLHRLPMNETRPAAASVRPSAAALDALSRDRLPAEALAAAGDGDSRRAPLRLVGALGDPRPSHQQVVNSLAYSPDGRWLASGSQDQTIILRETATGRVRRTLRGHAGSVVNVAFSKDSQTLVSASDDGTLRLWPVAKEAEPRTLKPDLGEVWRMAVSSDGRFLAAGGSNKTLKLWKWGEWDKPLRQAEMAGKVGYLAFSPDGESLAVGLAEQPKHAAIGIYQTASLQLRWKLAGHGPAKDAWVTGLMFAPDGKYLYSTGSDFRVKKWDLATGQLAQEIQGSQGDWRHPRAPAISPDGKHFIFSEASIINLLKTEELSTMRPLTGRHVPQLFVHGHFLGEQAAVFSPDSKQLAIGTSHGNVMVWNTDTWKVQLAAGGHDHAVWSVSVSPDGKSLLTTGDDNSVRRWNLDRWGENQVLFEDTDLLRSALYAPDGKTFTTAHLYHWWNNSRRQVIWDADTGKERLVVEQPVPGHSMTYSPDGKELTASGDDRVPVWDVSNGRRIHQFDPKGRAGGLAYSADGKYLAAGTMNTMTVVVWEAASGVEVRSWKTDGPIHAATFHPQQQWLATGHADGTVHLWDAGTGEKVRTFGGHSARITGLKFTPDGKALVSSGEDGTIRLWNPEQGRAREIIPVGPANRRLLIDLDPSGKYLFVAGDSPMVFVLRLGRQSD